MVDIPEGGTIRNTIQWELLADVGETLYLHACYGFWELTDDNVFDIFWSSYVIILNPTIGTHTNSIELTFPTPTQISFPMDVWTVLSTESNANNLNSANIIAEKLDLNEVNIIRSARIISTSFQEI